jgi:TonB family protein
VITRRWFLLLLGSPAFAPAEEPNVTHLADLSGDRVPVNTVAPVYPEVARRDRVEGDVQVCFHVDRQGRPFRIAVRTSTHRVFEKPSMRAVRASRYRPIPNDRAVPGIKSCRTFRFRLESVASNRQARIRKLPGKRLPGARP